MKKIKMPQKNILLLALLIILLILAVGFLYYIQRHKNESLTPVPTSSTQESIDYSPPTEEDKQRVDDNKQKIVDNQHKETTGNPAPAIKPVITYAGQYGQDIEVGGYIDLFEENGTCTATFVMGSAKIERTVSAVRGAKSVDCPVMSANSQDFTQKGMYTVTITYKSASTTATSEPKQIEVK